MLTVIAKVNTITKKDIKGNKEVKMMHNTKLN